MKGPQALFYGKNATAGVISFNTANPTDEFESQVRLGYETTSEDLSGEGFVSGPITPTLLGRLAVRVSNMSDGYFDQKAVDTPIGFLDLATFDGVVRNQEPNKGGLPGTQAYSARGTLVWARRKRLPGPSRRVFRSGMMRATRGTTSFLSARAASHNPIPLFPVSGSSTYMCPMHLRVLVANFPI